VKSGAGRGKRLDWRFSIVDSGQRFKAGAEFEFGEGDVEEFIAGCVAAEEGDVARGDAKCLGKKFRHRLIGGAVGGWGGDADLEAALVVEAGDGVAGGARDDADGER
jgi:hypothetical protein